MTYELYHHGILGMKWGVRRYQDKYGALTPAGKKHRAKLEADYDKLDNIDTLTKRGKLKKAEISKEYKSLTGKSIKSDKEAKTGVGSSSSSSSNSVNKSIKDMTNEELQATINRLDLEKRYANLTPDTRTKGQKFADSVSDKVLAPAILGAGKTVLQTYITKKALRALGVDGASDKVSNNAATKDAYNVAKKDVNIAKKNISDIQKKAEQDYEKQKASGAFDNVDVKQFVIRKALSKL